MVAGLISSLAFPHHLYLEELPSTVLPSSPKAPVARSRASSPVQGPDTEVSLIHFARASSIFFLPGQGAGPCFLIAVGGMKRGAGSTLMLLCTQDWVTCDLNNMVISSVLPKRSVGPTPLCAISGVGKG